MKVDVDTAIEQRLYLADPWFHVCLEETASNREFVANFDRLYGSDLARRRAPIVQMVDDATGKSKDDMRAFVEFVARYVWAVIGPDGKRERST